MSDTQLQTVPRTDAVIDADRSTYLRALSVFVVSRLIVVCGAGLGTLLPPVADSTKVDFTSAWYARLLRWDSGWYAAIVRDGYRYSTDAADPGSTVFYPLYPLLAYIMKTGLGISEFAALLIVSNVAAVAVVLLMTKLVTAQLGRDVALLCVMFFCLFPTSLFLSSGYTESLYIALALASFVMLTRDKPLAAAGFAGLALATRSTGIVLMPAILWDMAQRRTQPFARLALKMVACALVAASGLLAYMAYLAWTFGEPFSFVAGQSAWQNGTFADRFLSAITFATVRNANLWNSGWFIGFVALTIWSFRRLRPSLSIYAVGTLALPYLTLGVTGSMNRFLLTCFPAFMCLGLLCKGRSKITTVICGVFAVLLLACSALFSQWYWIG